MKIQGIKMLLIGVIITAITSDFTFLMTFILPILFMLFGKIESDNVGDI